MIILGLDPGLGTTGWGLIRAEGNRLSHLANGQVKTDAKESLARRLSHLDSQLAALIADHAPDAAAVEEVFVNMNPQSTLKLGQARGVVLLAVARAGIEPGEYAARLVKKAVVGVGQRGKAASPCDGRAAAARREDRRRRRGGRARGRDLPRASRGERAAAWLILLSYTRLFALCPGACGADLFRASIRNRASDRA